MCCTSSLVLVAKRDQSGFLSCFRDFRRKTRSWFLRQKTRFRPLQRDSKFQDEDSVGFFFRSIK